MLKGYDLYRDRIPGLERTPGAGGDSPHQSIRGFTPTFDKKLYFRGRDAALIVDATFRAGYGVLERGMAIAIDQNDTDKLIPYTPDTISLNDISRVFLLTDCDTADNFYVEMYESYKVAVGDVVVLTDTDGTYEQATISAIDRTTYDNKAKITLTGAVSGTFEISKLANCYLKAEDTASGKASKAMCVLDSDVDTGAGDVAEGALGPVLLSNAVIYQSACVFMDAQAISDLGNITSWGVFYILK